MRRLTLALLAMLVLGACTTRFVPVQAPGVMVEEDAAVFTIDDLRVVVQKRAWLREPDELNDYYTTFFIQVRNMNTAETRTLRPVEFSMLDETNRQFDLVSTMDVAELLLERDPYARYIGDLSLTPQDRDDRIRQQTEARANLQAYTFSFGDILPGAMKSGYVFFNRLPSSNEAATFIFRQRQVQFVRAKK